MSLNLTPEKAYIFRIVHVKNVPWILKHGGLACRNGSSQDPNYVNIGNADLIDKRSHRRVPIHPGGTLSDYVPFYFTPHSMMLFNITTGYRGITKRANEEIVIFVSSLPKLNERGVPFIFTNQHAYPVEAQYFSDTKDLNYIDWTILQNRNFKTDGKDPGKNARYQAEVLVHKWVPLDALLGLACYNEAVKRDLTAQLQGHNVDMAVRTTPTWYF